jgi:hypothetical protein
MIIQNGVGVADPTSGTQAYTFAGSAQFSMTALTVFSDLQNMFAEFRIRGVRLEIQLLNSPEAYVANSGAALLGSTVYPQIPEVIIAQNDTGSRIPVTQIQILQVQGAKRFMLNDVRPHVFQGVPKPSFIVQGLVSTEYALPNNNRDIWLNFPSAADVPHYLWNFIIQNFPGVNAPNNMAVRFSATLLFDCRRTY